MNAAMMFIANVAKQQTQFQLHARLREVNVC